jgi:nucleotide-binding universal stress UspA family protein
MFRSVLVGFDASDQSRDALALAQSLTERDGQLVVCCVHPPDPPLGEPIPPGLSMAVQARERLNVARSELDDPRATYVARGGPSAGEGLQLEAERRGCDLIVVGSSHRGTIGRIFPGSVTRQVLQAAPCAVAVAPRGLHQAPAPPPRTIGVGYDASAQARAALRAAADMARRCGAAVEVITIVDIVSDFGGWAAAWSYEEVLRAARSAAQARVDGAVGALQDVSATGSVLEGSAIEQLVAATGQLDLLVVGSRNYGPLRRALLGSVSGRVAEEAHCPVIVVPHAAEGEEAALGAEA